MAVSIKDKLDETELDERFHHVTQSITERYHDLAETVRSKYDDSDLDERFEGFRKDVSARFSELRGHLSQDEHRADPAPES